MFPGEILLSSDGSKLLAGNYSSQALKMSSNYGVTWPTTLTATPGRW
jgi:hypothetical protein